MPKIEAERLAAQQKKWFAAIREGLQRETGKSLAEWVEIAKISIAHCTGERSRTWDRMA